MKKISVIFSSMLILIVALSAAPVFADMQAPPPVSGFSGSPTTNSVLLSWITPSVENLAEFDVRYSQNPINDANFNLATQIANAPYPVSGSSQNLNVAGLQSGTTYHFGIKLFNIAGQASLIVTTSVTTQSGGGGGGGCTAPPAVSNFSGNPSSNAVTLSWITPSVTNLAEFDVRRSESVINDANFNLATRIANAPSPSSGQAQTLQATGLQSLKTYYFAIKVFNICGQASPIATVSATTTGGGGDGNGGGGGGGGGGAYDPNPPKNASILINDDAPKTATTSVKLTLSASGAIEMAISNSLSFSGINWEPYKTTKKWELTSQERTKSVYSIYKSLDGGVTSPVSDDILYEIPKLQPPVPPTPPTPPVPPIPPTPPTPPTPPGEIRGATYVDFNTLVTNWGDWKYGSAADLNRDGRVDNRDVYILMNKWNEIRALQIDEGQQGTILSLYPSRLTIVEGQEVSFIITATPVGGARNYTARVELKYPKDLFEMKSITYWKEWVPVIRPEYDEDSQEDGLLVKTAGFAGGFTDEKVFGVVKFVARKSGSGVVTFSKNSFVLNSINQDILASVGLPSKLSMKSVSGPSDDTRLLASILMLGERGNLMAFFVTFLIFLVLYAIYVWFRVLKPVEREEEMYAMEQTEMQEA